MQPTDLILAGLAAIAAGFVNAIAGGGTLITFPVLMALGIPPVAANITNTIALCPGYFGGTYAQRKDLSGQKNNILSIIPAGILGGITGGLLLIYTEEKTFKTLVPYLILIATILLAFQPLIKKLISRKSNSEKSSFVKASANFLFVFAAGIYGGYFGAGLGVILMAVLSLMLSESLIRINALKQMTSLFINLTAAIYFAFSPLVEWWFVLAMIVGAILGGNLGGMIAGKINASVLRWIIVIAGISISFYYFFE